MCHLRLLASTRVTKPTSAPSIHLSLRVEAPGTFSFLQKTMMGFHMSD
jgi:hypothetical protein